MRIVGGTVTLIAFARIYWCPLLDRHADLNAHGGLAAAVVFLHRQRERILPLIAGRRREDDNVLILRFMYSGSGH